MDELVRVPVTIYIFGNSFLGWLEYTRSCSVTKSCLTVCLLPVNPPMANEPLCRVLTPELNFTASGLYINGITQHGLFLVWFLSLSITTGRFMVFR